MLASAELCAAGSASAQDGTVERTDAEWRAWVPAIEEVSMPELAFVEDQDDRDNYEKYYYFHRPDTDFATALGDLRDCDAHARGLHRGSYYPDSSAAMTQYGPLAGAAGGLLVGVVADAIFGPAELRRKRRVNMRRCMFFKGYDRFGIDEVLWGSFNFEEGNGEVAEADRQRMLAQQALVASGPRPTTQELGL